MPIDPKLLVLTQWLSPAFPTGAFAYSHGLETACLRGWVRDAVTLEHWLRDVLEHGSGRTDAIWLGLAFDSEDLGALDALARAYAPSAERLREADRQGAAFAKTVSEVWGVAVPPVLLPLAVGCAAREGGLDLTSAKALYLQGFLGNLTAAAQRLMPLGQTDAQGVLARLSPLCTAVAEKTDGADTDALWSNAFLSDISAMAHETLEPRMFQT